MLKLESFIKDNKYPLAVRSSSLLEDSQYQPLAGTYETFMLPNNSRSKKKRLNELLTAIKRVYASTFKGEARALLLNTSHRIEEEKMAVIIQEVVGQTYQSKRFYPTFSGVLKSVNYYPVSYMKRNEGVAYLALGFGRTIVDGEKCLRISPKYPSILPQFYSMKAMRQNSQNHFYGLPLMRKDRFMGGADWSHVEKYLPAPWSPSKDEILDKVENGLIKELRINLLNKEKSSYWKLFSKGLLGRSAYNLFGKDSIFMKNHC